MSMQPQQDRSRRQHTCDKLVCCGRIELSLLHEDIGFVEQNNSLPARCESEKGCKALFRLDIPRVDGEQRSLGQVGDTLWLHHY